MNISIKLLGDDFMVRCYQNANNTQVYCSLSPHTKRAVETFEYSKSLVMGQTASTQYLKDLLISNCLQNQIQEGDFNIEALKGLAI